MAPRPPPSKKPKVEDTPGSVPQQPSPPPQPIGTPQNQQQYQRPPNGNQVRPPFQLGRLPAGQVGRPPMMGTPTQQQRQQLGQQMGQQGQGQPPNQNGNAQAGSSNQASSSYNSGSPAPPVTRSAAAGQTHGSLDDLTDGIIDYKEEEAALQKHAQPASRPRNAVPVQTNATTRAFLDPAWLRRRMTEVAKQEYALTINEDCIAYLSLAAEARVRDLLEAMIKARNHRLTSSHAHPPPMHEDGLTPLWSETITSEPAKWLATLERVEKEEEGRKRRERNARDEEERRRKEMGDDYNGPLGADVDMMGTPGGPVELDADGNPKKKKKSGPGVTARNMSEQAQKKMANSAALFSAGVKKKSWMFQSAGAGISSPSPASRTLNASSPLAGGPSPPAFGGDASGSSKPFNPSGLSQSSTAGLSTPVQSSWSKPFLSSTAGTPLGPPVHAASAPSHPRQNSGGFGGMRQDQPPLEVGAVSMRDAMFVLEKERGHGAGKGSASRLVAKAMGKRNDRGWE